MKKESILVGIIGLLIGVGITWATATLAVNNNNTGMMNAMGMRTNMDDSDMTMGQMTDMLKSKTGDDFDKTFLNEMIAHHEGAVKMADTEVTDGKNADAVALAKDIVSSQESEIKEMQDLLATL